MHWTSIEINEILDIFPSTPSTSPHKSTLDSSLTSLIQQINLTDQGDQTLTFDSIKSLAKNCLAKKCFSYTILSTTQSSEFFLNYYTLTSIIHIAKQFFHFHKAARKPLLFTIVPITITILSILSHKLQK